MMRKHKYKYILFCPYFGKLPDSFSLWLDSCSYNEQFKFIVITDDEFIAELPENVVIKKMKFHEFRYMVQSKFDFKISLEDPYKLCDYKPIYGYIFEDLISEYEYWGHCDLDLIFGDISKYLPSEKYDKISHLGHLCLYKNTKELRECFKLTTNSALDYRDILSSNMHFGFDEIGDYGVNELLINNGYTIYPYEKSIADISCTQDGMVLVIKDGSSFRPKKGERIFAFEDGKIIAYDYINNEIIKNEYAYIHMQKRKMINTLDNEKHNFFLIFPDRFGEYETVNKELILNNQQKKLLPITRIRIKWKSYLKKKQRKKVINEIIANKKKSNSND